MKRISGPMYVLAAAVLLSLGGVLIKWIPWGTMAVNGGRNLVAALVTGGYMVLTRQRPKVNRINLLCGVLICANGFLFTAATRLTTAANAIVIQYISPVFVILYMALLWRKRPERREVAACGVVFAGVCCFFVDGLTGGGAAGNLLAVAAAATYAVVFLTGRLEGSDSLSAFFISQVLSGAVGLPWLIRQPDCGMGAWIAIVFMGAVQISLAYLLLNRGLTMTTPVMANVICMAEPVLNPVWVALVCGETVGALSLVGIVVVMGGLLGYYLTQNRSK